METLVVMEGPRGLQWRVSCGLPWRVHVASCGECPVVPHGEVELEGLLFAGWGGARWVWAHLCLTLGGQGHQEGLCDRSLLSRRMTDRESCLPRLRGRWPCTGDLGGSSLGTVQARGPREGLGYRWFQCVLGVLLPQASHLWLGLSSETTQIRRLRKRNILAFWLGPSMGC